MRKTFKNTNWVPVAAQRIKGIRQENPTHRIKIQLYEKSVDKDFNCMEYKLILTDPNRQGRHHGAIREYQFDAEPYDGCYENYQTEFTISNHFNTSSSNKSRISRYISRMKEPCGDLKDNFKKLWNFLFDSKDKLEFIGNANGHYIFYDGDNKIKSRYNAKNIVCMVARVNSKKLHLFILWGTQWRKFDIELKNDPKYRKNKKKAIWEFDWRWV